MACGCFGDCLRGAVSDDGAAADTAFGSDVNDVVGVLDDIKVVFNEKDGVAAVNEFVEYSYQPPDILIVKSDCGFVQQVDGFPGCWGR